MRRAGRIGNVSFVRLRQAYKISGGVLSFFPLVHPHQDAADDQRCCNSWSGKKEQQAGLGNPSDINGGNRKTNEPCGYRTAKNDHRVTYLHWLTA